MINEVGKILATYKFKNNFINDQNNYVRCPSYLLISKILQINKFVRLLLFQLIVQVPKIIGAQSYILSK